jgi:hypothetical protein
LDLCAALFAIGSDGSAGWKTFDEVKEKKKKKSLVNGIEIISKETRMSNAFFFFLSIKRRRRRKKKCKSKAR